LETDPVHVEGPVQKMRAAPNRPKKQTVDSAACNNDTLVDSAVAAYPIRIHQRWPNFGPRHPFFKHHVSDCGLQCNSTGCCLY